MVILDVLYAWDSWRQPLWWKQVSVIVLAVSQIQSLDIFICVNVSLTGPRVRLLLCGFLAGISVRRGAPARVQLRRAVAWNRAVLARHFTVGNHGNRGSDKRAAGDKMPFWWQVGTPSSPAGNLGKVALRKKKTSSASGVKRSGNSRAPQRRRFSSVLYSRSIKAAIWPFDLKDWKSVVDRKKRKKNLLKMFSYLCFKIEQRKQCLKALSEAEMIFSRITIIREKQFLIAAGWDGISQLIAEVEKL